MRRTLLLSTLFLTFAFCPRSAYGQTMEQTTLAESIVEPTTGSSGGYQIYLASCQYVLPPGLAQSQGSIGNSLGANYYLLLIDAEFFRVNGVNTGVTPCQVTIERGVQGSTTAAHSTGTIVYTAPASLFGYYPPFTQPMVAKAGKRPFFARIGNAFKRAWKALF